MHINEQNLVADEILGTLEKFNPNCILVGGAPRDWYMGNYCNDLDIFIGHSSKDLLSHLSQNGINECLEVKELLPHQNHTKAICCLYKFNFKGMHVQVLMPKGDLNVFEMLNRVDMSTSKIFYKRGTIYPSTDFLDSVSSKVITCTGGSESYISKIADKFPDFCVKRS